jgi:aryl-alcohol dehydrogenase-like predicted oxidoreductase
VSELALGTWGLSGDAYGPVAAAEQDQVIDRALAFGITLFDTADVYGKGEMEKRLGERLGDDANVTIVTKWGTDLVSKPTRKRFDVAYLEEAMTRSGERLRRNTLDIGLLHNPSLAAVKAGEATGLLQQWVNDGKMRAWGISAGDVDVVRAALELPEPPAVVEMAFNVFFSEDVLALAAELKERQIGLLARSVLAHGLLAGMWPTDKTFAPEDHRSQRWTGDQLRRRVHQLRAMRSLQSSSLPSMRSAAVAYVLNHDVVSAAVLGPRDVMQLDQLIRETPRQAPYLDERAKEALDAQLLKLGIVPMNPAAASNKSATPS